MQVSIKTNAIDAKHFFDGLARDQIPFAMSKSVNAMAFDLRDREQKQIGRYLELRTPWLTKKGAMPVVPSKKTQLPNIHAIVGVKDEVAALTAIGGTKKANKKDMAVPMGDTGTGTSAREMLNPGKRTLGPSKWPGRIVKPAKGKGKGKKKGQQTPPKPFLLTGKSGRTFVAMRVGQPRAPLEILYELLTSVAIPEIWPLVYHSEYFVATEYDKYFNKALNDAINSKRR